MCIRDREYYMLLHFVKTAEEFVRYAAVWKLDGVICIWLNEEACTRIRQMCAVPVAAIYRTDRIYGKAGEEVARFLFKREKQRIWFLDGTEEYGKVVWQGMQKIFSKKGCCLEDVYKRQYRQRYNYFQGKKSCGVYNQ